MKTISRLIVLVTAMSFACGRAYGQDSNEQLAAQQAQAAQQGQGPPGDPNAPKPNAAAGKGAGNPADKEAQTIKRPTEPKAAPTPRAFDIKPDEQGMLQFQYRDQAWPDVLQWLADVSGLALDWQELPADLLSIATPGKMSLVDTRDMLNRHLLSRGFTMLEFPGVLQVVKTKEINGSLVPRVDP